MRNIPSPFRGQFIVTNTTGPGLVTRTRPRIPPVADRLRFCFLRTSAKPDMASLRRLWRSPHGFVWRNSDGLVRRRLARMWENSTRNRHYRKPEARPSARGRMDRTVARHAELIIGSDPPQACGLPLSELYATCSRREEGAASGPRHEPSTVVFPRLSAVSVVKESARATRTRLVAGHIATPCASSSPPRTPGEAARREGHVRSPRTPMRRSLLTQPIKERRSMWLKRCDRTRLLA